MVSAQGTYDLDVMTQDTIDAAQIPPVTRVEARALARAELDRFLTLAASLSVDDWEQPTDCTLWTVRDILAHQAGAYASGANLREFLHQGKAKPGPGQEKIDAINACQIADRAGRAPEQLIAELRRVGPDAIDARYRLSRWLGWVPFPLGPPVGTAPFRYLLDVIYPRDTWAHRLDISRATGRSFRQIEGHDRRMVALVMRDLAHHLKTHLNGQAVVFDLSGVAGGRFHIGRSVEPSAVVKMEVLAFNRLASGRLTLDEALADGEIAITGDRSFAEHVLQNTEVLY